MCFLARGEHSVDTEQCKVPLGEDERGPKGTSVLTVCFEAVLAAKERSTDTQPGMIGQSRDGDCKTRTCCMSDTPVWTGDFPEDSLCSGTERLVIGSS